MGPDSQPRSPGREGSGGDKACAPPRPPARPSRWPSGATRPKSARRKRRWTDTWPWAVLPVWVGRREPNLGALSPVPADGRPPMQPQPLPLEEARGDGAENTQWSRWGQGVGWGGRGGERGGLGRGRGHHSKP